MFARALTRGRRQWWSLLFSSVAGTTYIVTYSDRLALTDTPRQLAGLLPGVDVNRLSFESAGTGVVAVAAVWAVRGLVYAGTYLAEGQDLRLTSSAAENRGHAYDRALVPLTYATLVACAASLAHGAYGLRGVWLVAAVIGLCALYPLTVALRELEGVLRIVRWAALSCWDWIARIGLTFVRLLISIELWRVRHSRGEGELGRVASRAENRRAEKRAKRLDRHYTRVRRILGHESSQVVTEDSGAPL